MPTVLALGVIVPELVLIFKPVVEEYMPPVIPVCVADCALERVLQNGEPAKLILALGAAVIDNVVVVVTSEQPDDAAIVYDTVKVAAVLEIGLIAPVL